MCVGLPTHKRQILCFEVTHTEPRGVLGPLGTARGLLPVGLDRQSWCSQLQGVRTTATSGTQQERRRLLCCSQQRVRPLNTPLEKRAEGGCRTSLLLPLNFCHHWLPGLPSYLAEVCQYWEVLPQRSQVKAGLPCWAPVPKCCCSGGLGRGDTRDHGFPESSERKIPGRVVGTGQR